MTLLPTRRLLLWGAGIAVVMLAAQWLPAPPLLLLALNGVLACAALLDWAMTPRPGALEVMRLAPERLSVLAHAIVTIRIRNRSSFALPVRVKDSAPEGFGLPEEELSARAAAHGETTLTYAIRPHRRGRAIWGPLYVRYRSVLGLWERQIVVPAAAVTRVYPDMAALHRYHLLARTHRLETLGIRKVRRRGTAWEFESLRDYARGDDVRLIDWKATARRRKHIVRNQEAERNQSVIILVDCGRLMNAEVDGMSKLDHAVNSALMLAHVALTRGDRVGLCTFSSKAHAWAPPRAHLPQMRLLTDTLYDLRGDFTETDHGRCLRLLRTRHRKRALLVVLTDFVDATTAEDMIAHLHRAARLHLVLFVALGDPFLRRAATCRPVTAVEGFGKASAIDLLHERQEVLERLRKSGAHVIDAEPGGITAPLLSEYLAIAFRGQL